MGRPHISSLETYLNDWLVRILARRSDLSSSLYLINSSASSATKDKEYLEADLQPHLN